MALISDLCSYIRKTRVKTYSVLPCSSFFLQSKMRESRGDSGDSPSHLTSPSSCLPVGYLEITFDTCAPRAMIIVKCN
jgi:hypothetical protein